MVKLRQLCIKGAQILDLALHNGRVNQEQTVKKVTMALTTWMNGGYLDTKCPDPDRGILSQGCSTIKDNLKGHLKLGLLTRH